MNQLEQIARAILTRYQALLQHSTVHDNRVMYIQQMTKELDELKKTYKIIYPDNHEDVDNAFKQLNN